LLTNGKTTPTTLVYHNFIFGKFKNLLVHLETISLQYEIIIPVLE